MPGKPPALFGMLPVSRQNPEEERKGMCDFSKLFKKTSVPWDIFFSGVSHMVSLHSTVEVQQSNKGKKRQELWRQSRSTSGNRGKKQVAAFRVLWSSCIIQNQVWASYTWSRIVHQVQHSLMGLLAHTESSKLNVPWRMFLSPSGPYS